MSDTTTQTPLTALKERHYKRNYIAFMLDGFFFSFSASYFSQTTVLPVYVSNLSGNSIFIGLLAVLYFGFSNGAAVFSCVLGVNTKSPKWTSIWICMLERVGFLLIFLTTFTVARPPLALALFFFSFALYASTAGLASPVYSALVSETMYRNVSSFYGSYYLIGSLAGVLGAQPIKFVLEQFTFPWNYRWLFLLGLVVAWLSTLSLAVGIKEVKEDHGQRLSFAMLPAAFRDALRNKGYRSFVLVRIISAMADMSVPFYIIRVKDASGGGDSIVGVMTTVFLLSDMVSSKLLGRIGDRFGVAVMARLAVGAGVLAGFLALVYPSPWCAYPLFFLVSAASRGMQLATQVASITYAPKGKVPIFAATSGLSVAPFYVLFSFAGGVLANRFSNLIVFTLSMCLYALAFVVSMITRKTMRLNESD